MVVALEDTDDLDYNKSLDRCTEMYGRNGIKICGKCIYSDISHDNILEICNYIIDDMRNKCLINSKKKLKLMKKS